MPLLQRSRAKAHLPAGRASQLEITASRGRRTQRPTVAGPGVPRSHDQRPAVAGPSDPRSQDPASHGRMSQELTDSETIDPRAGGFEKGGFEKTPPQFFTTISQTDC